MSHPYGTEVRVIDNYFPDWLVDSFGTWLVEYCPLFYNNTPYGDYNKARFFGNTVIRDNEFTDTTPWHYFYAYLNECIMHDIGKDLPLSHIHRVLVNAQCPGQTSQTHTDHDIPATSIIYHAYGKSGATTFKTGEKVEFKKGRLVLFDSFLEHDGEPPNEDIRISLGIIAPHKGVHLS